MNIFFILILFSLSTFAEVPIPRAATGLEAGVARLSDGNKTVTGTSWMYVFEYQPDKNFSFIGQAGTSTGEEDSYRIKMTSFTGGMIFYLLPQIGVQLGISNNVIETDEVKETKLGPLFGLSFYVPAGIFKLGGTATIIRVGDVHSSALRGMILLEI